MKNVPGKKTKLLIKWGLTIFLCQPRFCMLKKSRLIMIWNWVHNAQILQECCIGNSVCTQNHISFLSLNSRLRDMRRDKACIALFWSGLLTPDSANLEVSYSFWVVLKNSLCEFLGSCEIIKSWWSCQLHQVHVLLFSPHFLSNICNFLPLPWPNSGGEK